MLQHLDNATIQRVLGIVDKYPWIIVTESRRIRPKAVNLDIKPGAWTRTLFGSGIYVDQLPFSREIETLLEVGRNDDVVIHTGLLRH